MTMSDTQKQSFQLPPEQQAIRDKCFHPSGTFVEFPIEDVETSIPARFEKIVAQFPHQIAVRSETETLTYDQVNSAANRLARVILDRRDRRQEPVALFLENSVPLIIANLAILKSGNIALHVDPLAPMSRISHMMADSQVSLVLTDSRTNPIAYERLSESSNFLNIDERGTDISDQNLDLPISPDDYAKISYTSGSTGQAKGALKSHRSILHSVIHFSNSCHICAEDRLVIVGRGAVGKYLFISLLNGARQCVFDISKEGLLQLGNKLSQEEITILMTMPTAFRHLLSTVSIQNRFPSLRLIRFTGEPTLKRDFDLYKAHFNDECLLVNTYAAQETGDICLYFIDKNTVISGNRVPVGYPKTSTNVYIIDELGNELSCDQPGQIVVQSEFLPPGYLVDEDYATEDNPSRQNKAGKQYYQTGDIGIMSANGCLVLLGRKDSQVKIRSYRVDIGEVEATLTEHPGVKEASVVAKEIPSGDTILAGYVVCNSEQMLTVTALRKFLAERLPEYMVPAVFTFLPKLPLTATGKVDRRALPDFTNNRPNLATPYVESRTTVERQLALIWSEILSLREIGINDNFFELGGHSLAAMRVVSRVIIQFQLDVPLQSLFQSPTVAEMATVITQNQTKQASDTDLAQMLREVEALTEEEAQKQLAKGECAELNSRQT
jgi:acyl-coenzyme A synthetase/AMP-(fatty) acid ligase/acyl carrier protein